jgi:predicted phosphodiesterase
MIKPFAHPEFSMWLSAVDEVVASHASVAQTEDVDAGPAPVQRPDTSDGMVQAAVTAGRYLENDISLAQQAVVNNGPAATEDVADSAKYCSSIWWEIAKAMASGDKQAEANWRAQLGPFGSCDPRYAETAEKYVEYFKLKGGTIPYIRWKNLDDFIIDWPLPANATIAIVGDWGTGQQDAKALLAAVARKKPDVVIHLGDVYYSGTEFEVENYFMSIWRSTLDLTKTRTFSLAGNHDMYSGGQAYYRMIQELGQPASYFSGKQRARVAHRQDPDGGKAAHRAAQPQSAVHGFRRRRRRLQREPPPAGAGRRPAAERHRLVLGARAQPGDLSALAGCAGALRGPRRLPGRDHRDRPEAQVPGRTNRRRDTQQGTVVLLARLRHRDAGWPASDSVVLPDQRP